MLTFSGLTGLWRDVRIGLRLGPGWILTLLFVPNSHCSVLTSLRCTTTTTTTTYYVLLLLTTYICAQAFFQSWLKLVFYFSFLILYVKAYLAKRLLDSGVFFVTQQI